MYLAQVMTCSVFCGMIEITDETEGGISICRIDGRLDGATSARADQHLTSLAEQGVPDLVLDFSSFEYMSSAGLRVLLMPTKRAKCNSSQLVLAAPQEVVKQVLEISGFSSILEIQEARQEALDVVGFE